MKKIDLTKFRCPVCRKGKLTISETQSICSSCKQEFSVEKNVYYFESLQSDAVSDWFDKLKYFVKNILGSSYNRFVNLISPVYFQGSHLKRYLRPILQNPDRGMVINLGSGSSKISDDVINIDIFPYEHVDIVCNISNLPLTDGSVDAIFIRSVLEHVQKPEVVVGEIYRVLKPGGFVYCSFPFICGFHASPHDYSRLTREGLKQLFNQYEVIEVKTVAGPASGFLWVFQELMAMLLSFGLSSLYKIWLLVFIGITFPIKFLDIFLLHHPMADNIASSFAIAAVKQEKRENELNEGL